MNVRPGLRRRARDLVAYLPGTLAALAVWSLTLGMLWWIMGCRSSVDGWTGATTGSGGWRGVTHQPACPSIGDPAICSAHIRCRLYLVCPGDEHHPVYRKGSRKG